MANIVEDASSSPPKNIVSNKNSTTSPSLLDSNDINKLLEEVKGDLIPLKLATGNSNFANIIEEEWDYVDKSMFIKEIVESSD